MNNGVPPQRPGGGLGIGLAIFGGLAAVGVAAVAGAGKRKAPPQLGRPGFKKKPCGCGR